MKTTCLGLEAHSLCADRGLKQTYQPEGLLTVQLAGQFPAHAPDVGLDGTFRVDLTGSASLGQEVLIFIGHALVLGD